MGKGTRKIEVTSQTKTSTLCHSLLLYFVAPKQVSFLFLSLFPKATTVFPIRDNVSLDVLMTEFTPKRTLLSSRSTDANAVARPRSSTMWLPLPTDLLVRNNAQRKKWKRWESSTHFISSYSLAFSLPPPTMRASFFSRRVHRRAVEIVQVVSQRARHRCVRACVYRAFVRACVRAK